MCPLVDVMRNVSLTQATYYESRVALRSTHFSSLYFGGTTQRGLGFRLVIFHQSRWNKTEFILVICSFKNNFVVTALDHLNLTSFTYFNLKTTSNF